ncbi:hypothetical protein J5500_03370 [Candidatus Saccharibacteria bacterium]|nr:hypothetical protein [Candidatus Saccharibacteria bacterium]
MVGSLSLNEIRDSSTKELIAGLRERRFSLLKSLGFKKLRAGMIMTGFVCRMIVFLTGLRKAVRRAGSSGLRYSDPARKRIRKLLQIVTPVDRIGAFPHPDEGMVVGFNHPSLGEILRFIYICIVEYRHRRNLFPVNLPWYEALMPIADELEAIGIYITPILTPSTRAKMAKEADEETMKVIDELARGFNVRYLDDCVEFIRSEDNIWIAPSATRQATVFKTVGMMDGSEAIAPQTMTLVATGLVRGKVENCTFLSVCVIPPHKFKRGLNLFREYRIGVGKTMTMQDARENVRKRCEKNTGRMFEYMYLMNISEALIKYGGSRFICPGA